MMEALYRLAYFSRNTVRDSADAKEQGVDRIRSLSRRNDAAADVNGALLFNMSCFAQVLEEPMGAVEKTFERIQRDPRYSDVTVLEISPVGTRGFPKWSMAFAGQLEEKKGTFCSFKNSSTRPDESSVQDLYSLLHGLVLQEEEAR